MRIVGREAELEQVRRFLTETGSGFRALHLHGEAGIGKSTIWQRAVVEAAERGYRVVSTRPAEAEARLPFAGLNDLFGDLVDDVPLDLPAPQRLALDVALLRASVDGPRPEPLAISLAVLGLVRAASVDRPLVMAIDDVPWLDESSASVLEFVIRRLDDEPIGLILAERRSSPSTTAPRLASVVPAERMTEAAVAPLSARETDRLVSEALGLDLPPSTLSRLHRTSGGNPFYAVEIARALQRRGLTTLDGDLPLPDTLTGLVRDRLGALSPSAAAVVAHASALSQPTVDMLVKVVGKDEATIGLADATTAGVISADDDLVRFTHPLLAAEAYAGVDEARRRDMHRRLAWVVKEREEHARHLALSAAGPDENVAQELERAAERAHDRGAPDAAADLAERAIALTPDDGAVRRRRHASAAQYRMWAGDIGRAREWLESALEEAPPGEGRAEILYRLGNVRQLMGDWPAAEELSAEALEQAEDDVRLRIEIKLLLGGVSHITGRNWDAGAQHVADAMRLAEGLGDPRVLAGTIGHYATWQYVTGHGYSPELERRAAELEPWTGHLRVLDHPDFDFSLVKWQEGDLRGARALHERLLERAERNGDYSSITFLLANLAGTDFADGRLDVAADRLDRAERLARATGQQTALAHVLSWRVGLLARLGRAEEAWQIGHAALRLIAETGWVQGEPAIRVDLALLELSRRNPAAAHEVIQAFIPPASHVESRPMEWKSPIDVEALIGMGRLEDARVLLERIDQDSRTPWIAATVADAERARALLTAAEGDLDEATRLAEAAHAIYVARDDRWEQARTRLIAGEIHRRARRRAKARSALADAVAIFDNLGAVLWATEAREQLERIGAGRDEARGGLTPTQQQVANLVIGGLTNRQVADRLFMSVHTVEAHLSAIYRTLDIRSRGELGQALGRDGQSIRDTRQAIRDSAPLSGPET